MNGSAKGCRKHLVRFLCVAVAAGGLGCMSNQIKVQQSGVQFNDRSDQIALRAGLVIDDEARRWVYTYKKLGVTYDFALGQALEADAPEALKKSFQEVVGIAAPGSPDSDVKRVVTLKFGPGTDWKFGPVVMAANHATVELLCEISGKNGKALWSGSALGHADKTAGIYGYLPGPMNSWINKAYGRIFHDALTDALEKLNDQILTDGRKKIAG